MLRLADGFERELVGDEAGDEALDRFLCDLRSELHHTEAVQREVQSDDERASVLQLGERSQAVAHFVLKPTTSTNVENQTQVLN